jgi:DNA polymerase III subunit delta
MEFENIISKINNRIFSPVYFLAGDEPYFIDKISKLIENTVLDESERDFAQNVVYGQDTSVDQIMALAKEYPGFGPYRVVIVREAQHIKNLDKNDYLKAYMKKPIETTILVFDYKYKKLDGRTEFAKLVKKNGVLFISKAKRDYEIPDYIEKLLRQKGFSVSLKTKMLLAESLGTSLSKIENEIGKLLLNIEKGAEITPALVEENIGISKDYNIFELQRAIAKRDIVKANKIINFFGANPKEYPAIWQIIMLFSYFTKIFYYHFISNKSDNNKLAVELGINPYFVNEYKSAAHLYSIKKTRSIIALLREYDQKAKGVESANIEDGELMKELIFKIMH